MIKKLIKLVIGLLAISWFAKKMHNHHCHSEKKAEEVTSKLRRYMGK
jgi:hypothetical protein